jgi:hypothetical protein
MMKVKCLKCEGIVEYIKGRTAGCFCDPDAPTWIGIGPDKKLLKLSNVKYEVIDDG